MSIAKGPQDISSKIAETEFLGTSNQRSVGEMLISAIAEAVAQKVQRMVGVHQRLMDITAAAMYLGMSEHALRHKAGKDIPCVRLDGKLRFDRRDLDRHIDLAPREGV
jgi:hypothetical protein